jgi:hypothetical protein
MRCDDLTRELASPTGALAPAQIAGHLAVCPACAEWSRLAGQFDRIWEATRPAEPSMDAMDVLWARASVELDALETPATLKFVRPDRLRRWGMVALVAQAAAVLVATLILLPRGGARPVEVAVNPPAPRKEPVLLDVRVEDDQLGVVRIDAKGKAPRLDMQDLSRLYASSSLPAYTPHDEVSEMESSALDLVAAAP